MDIQEFCLEFTKQLKKLGFKKSGFCWCKKSNGLVYSIAIEVPLYNIYDYYVNVGVSYDLGKKGIPNQSKWLIVHRCSDGIKDINLSCNYALRACDGFFINFSCPEDIDEAINSALVVKKGDQYVWVGYDS